MQISELKLAKDLIRKPSITPKDAGAINLLACLLYTSPSPRDQRGSGMAA